ncbi:MAG TPA: alpha/beta fold hydrolase [Thermoplasmatales archaeon]|nr:alpha/beta fold hydrolase [Thermoplasmatales archaeon]
MKKEDIICTEPTSDCIQLKIKRYKPRGGDIAEFPVILCHGVLSNKHSLDFGEKHSSKLRGLWKKYSLASYLYEGGKNKDLKFDVWVPELRGKRSFKDFKCDKYPDTPTKYNWCMDHYIDYDVPVIVNRVLSEYDYSTKVFWIGMSMGGMLAYAYGETQHGFKNLKGVVTIGSPVAFESNMGWMPEVASIFTPRKISTKFNFKEFLERRPLLKEEILKNGVNPDNIDKKVIEKFIELGFDNYVSSKILNHFAIFFRHNNFCRYPRYPWIYDFFDRVPLLKKGIIPYSYKESLYKFKTPLLAIAGGADKEAPPKEVKYAVAHVGSKDVKYCEFSKDSPFTDIDYAHLDFHKGKRARDEVYSVIHEWLKRKCTEKER